MFNFVEKFRLDFFTSIKYMGIFAVWRAHMICHIKQYFGIEKKILLNFFLVDGAKSYSLHRTFIWNRPGRYLMIWWLIVNKANLKPTNICCSWLFLCFSHCCNHLQFFMNSLLLHSFLRGPYIILTFSRIFVSLDLNVIIASIR